MNDIQLGAMTDDQQHKVWRPAIRVLEWCEKASLPSPAHPLSLPFGTALLGATFLWVELRPGRWSAAAVLGAIVLEITLAYLNSAATHRATALSKRVWDKIGQLNRDNTGNVWLITNCFCRRHRRNGAGRLTPDQYKTELKGLQQHLLSHAVDVIHAQPNINLPERSLYANWALRGENEHSEEFRVVLYNRNMTHRRPQLTDWKPIEEGRPGASGAFLKGEVTLVEDTHDEAHQKFFPGSPAYRSILSIPMIAEDQVIGVMNIDAAEPHVLQIEHENLVMDIAYLVGLCEVLRND